MSNIKLVDTKEHSIIIHMSEEYAALLASICSRRFVIERALKKEYPGHYSNNLVSNVLGELSNSLKQYDPDRIV